MTKTTNEILNIIEIMKHAEEIVKYWEIKRKAVLIIKMKLMQ